MGALTATDYKTPKQILIGNTNPSGRGMNGNVFDSEGVAPTITTNKGEGAKIAIPVLTPDRHGVVVAGNLQGNHDQNNRVYDPKGIAPTLTTMQGGGQEPKIICSTDFRIRKLTPRECWRLQGFPDWAFDKAATVNSNSQLYKQAGNSVTVPVIYEIAKRLEVYA